MARIKMLSLSTVATANLATAEPISSAQQRQKKRYLATNSRRWLKIRAIQLDREPLCRMCRKEGRDEPGTVVDHINGRADRKEDYVWNNLQTLCDHHHGQKTMTQTHGGDVPVIDGPEAPKFSIA